MATLTDSQQSSAAAAATATILVNFAQVLGRLLTLWVRGSANASATIANLFDNAVGDYTSTGTPTTTSIAVAGTPWTGIDLTGRVITITAAGDPLFRQSRAITSNTANTLNFSAFGSAPVASGTFSVGNLWVASDTAHGNAWTADGGAGTSHGQWWHVVSCYGQSANTTTVTVVWGGGTAANTLTIEQYSTYDTANPVSTATAASGNSGTPTCNSISPSVSGYLSAGYQCPTTAQTWSSALDNSSGNAMTITQPSGTSRAATPTLVKASGGTFAPRITMSTSEGWVATPLYINDAAGAAAHAAPFIPRQVRFFPRRRVV